MADVIGRLDHRNEQPCKAPERWRQGVEVGIRELRVDTVDTDMDLGTLNRRVLERLRHDHAGRGLLGLCDGILEVEADSRGPNPDRLQRLSTVVSRGKHQRANGCAHGLPLMTE